MHGGMNRWVDGGMNRWVEGGMNRWVDGGEKMDRYCTHTEALLEQHSPQQELFLFPHVA